MMWNRISIPMPKEKKAYKGLKCTSDSFYLSEFGHIAKFSYTLAQGMERKV